MCIWIKGAAAINYQKIPFVREWGSWVVLIYSCFAGLVIGLQTRPWLVEGGFSLRTFSAILGLVFLVNSKASLASLLRTRQKDLGWFLFFSLTGLMLLMPFLFEAAHILIVSSLLVLTYLAFVSGNKEHSLFAELNGFALLALSAPIIYFVITDDLSWRLYAAVLTFFWAGVIKVRVRLKKTIPYRALMLIYCVAAPTFYYYLEIPIILLLPLAENIISIFFMREEALRTTGNIELIKGALFLILAGFFWQ